MSDDRLTMPADAPTPDWHYPLEECPHCEQGVHANRMDEHIAAAHAGIPPCTATLDSEHTAGVLACVLRVGHKRGDGVAWHVSAHGPVGRYVWNDSAEGATPHRSEEESGA